MFVQENAVVLSLFVLCEDCLPHLVYKAFFFFEDDVG